MDDKAHAECEPIGPDAIRIDFNRSFSFEEGARLRRGGFGDMDSKWSYLYEDGWLSIYRGVGECWARLKLRECPDGVTVGETWASPTAFENSGCKSIGGYLIDILNCILDR